MANFCFHWGVTLQWWEKVTQPLIPKDPGPPCITHLWHIFLLKADLNVCLSELVFGHRLMTNAECYNLLHPSQHGAQRGKMSISTVLLKQLSYNIIQQTQTDACMFDNNARACYDRMIPSIAMITKCQHAGLPKPAAKVVLELFHLMKYHVCTAYVVSSSAFSNKIDWILGILQGSGHSCPFWGLTSSVMLDRWREHLVPLFTPLTFQTLSMD